MLTKFGNALLFGVLFIVTADFSNSFANQIQEYKPKSAHAPQEIEPDPSEWDLAINYLTEHPEINQSVEVPNPHKQNREGWKFIVSRTRYPGYFHCESYQNNLRRNIKICSH